MKGFIDVTVNFVKDGTTGLQKPVTFIKIKNLDIQYTGKKGLSCMFVPVRHEMTLSRVQVQAARRKLLADIENKNGLVFPSNPAEFNHVIKEDGSDYYVVVADIGTKEKPCPKSFYLNHDHIDLLDSFRLEYQFTDVKEFNDPEAEETESNE